MVDALDDHVDAGPDRHALAPVARNRLGAGPNGYSAPATIVGTYTDGSPLAVTYAVPAPHGTWAAAQRYVARL